MSRLCELDVILILFRPYKRGVTGSNPVAPTRKDQVRPHVDPNQTYPRNHSGNHRCTLAGVEKGPQVRGSIVVDHKGAPYTDSRDHRHLPGPLARHPQQGLKP
jgi:hypothetical protein